MCLCKLFDFLEIYSIPAFFKFIAFAEIALIRYINEGGGRRGIEELILASGNKGGWWGIDCLCPHPHIQMLSIPILLSVFLLISSNFLHLKPLPLLSLLTSSVHSSSIFILSIFLLFPSLSSSFLVPLPLSSSSPSLFFYFLSSVFPSPFFHPHPSLHPLHPSTSFFRPERTCSLLTSQLPFLPLLPLAYPSPPVNLSQCVEVSHHSPSSIPLS